MWSYERLWKTLEENNMKAKDLVTRKILTKTMCDHMLKNEPVPMKYIGKLCTYFHCNVDKIVEYIRIEKR